MADAVKRSAAEEAVSEAARRGARSRWGPEHVFAGLVAGFGLVIALVLPPGQGPDEPSHFPRACHVADGRLFPEMFPVSEWGGGWLPLSVQRTMDAFFEVGNNPQRQVVTERFGLLWRLRLHPKHRLAIIYSTAAHYAFVPYVPSATAIVVARRAGLRMLGQFYAGRLANLALAVLALFWAIRICPVYKRVFGMTALIPIAVQQCSVYSPDASTLSAAFLLAALLLRLGIPRDADATSPLPALSKGTVAALFALTIWLALCKIPYVVLLLLYAAVPAARIGGRRRYLALGGGLAVAVACCLPLVNHGRHYVPNRMVGVDRSNIDEQIHSIRERPIRYAGVLAATVADHSAIWLDQLGHLGWQDTHMNRMALYVYLVVLVLVALAEGSMGPRIPPRVKAAALAASVLGVAVIVTSCYIAGSTPESQLVYGPQGRYFLPLLPLALLSVSSPALRVQAEPRFLLALAASSGAAVLVVALVAMVRRYYISTDWELTILPLSLAAALLLVMGIVQRAARRALSVPMAGDR